MMDNKITENELKKILSKRSNGEISFTQFLEKLSERGINEYEIDVTTGQATYKADHTVFRTDTQISLVISDKFNKNKALEAIANIALPFLDFLKEIADAGIVTYRVYIPEQKVTYIGVGGEEINE